MARGNRRESIFRDEADRLVFYQTLGEACERTGWRVHAWVLMSNHYHLMVETPEANLVAGMRWPQNSYLRADGSEAELDSRQTGDAQRCKCQPTSSPVPSVQIIQAASCFKGVSPICQDVLTDPLCFPYTPTTRIRRKMKRPPPRWQGRALFRILSLFN